MDKLGKSRCAIKSWEASGVVTAGTATFENGAVFFTVTPGYEMMMANVINTPVLVRGSEKRVTLDEDPVLWFENLPYTYRGAYVWAEMI